MEAVLRSTPDTPAPMIGLRENKITCEPLMKAVELVSLNYGKDNSFINVSLTYINVY